MAQNWKTNEELFACHLVIHDEEGDIEKCKPTRLNTEDLRSTVHER